MQILAKLPYQMALNIFRLLAKTASSTKTKIWARNSYALNTLVPFKSDLDVTVWCESSAVDADLLAKMARFVHVIKEIHLYNGQEARRFQGMANYFEMSRDPKTFNKLRLNKEDLDIQGAVFLLRMLEADYLNLIKNPGLRLKKWSQHLALVGRPRSLDARNLLDQILGAIAETLAENENEQRDIINQIEAHLEQKLSSESIGYHERELLMQRHPWWMALFPHRYCFNKNPTVIPTVAFHKTLIYQIAWELWGLMTQMEFIKDKAQLSTHLSDLADYIRLVDQKNLLEMASYLGNKALGQTQSPGST